MPGPPDRSLRSYSFPRPLHPQSSQAIHLPCCGVLGTIPSTRLVAFIPESGAMLSPSRRAFLGASVAGLAGGRLLAADPPLELNRPVPDDAAFQPSTLFLTWQRDPTTTMTVQWVGTAGETADTTVYYSPARAGRRRGRPQPTDRQAVPDDRLQGLPRRADRPDAGDRLPVPHRQAVADLPLPHDAGQGDRHDPLRLRRRLRRQRARGRQQHPGGPAGPDVRRRSAATWATTTAGRSRSAWRSCATTASTWSAATAG